MNAPAMKRAELSKSLFGQALKLDLMLYIGQHPTGIFTWTDCRDGVGVKNVSSIQRSMESLIEVGLIVRDDLEASSGEKPFRRIPSLGWDFAAELAESSTD